MYYKLIGREPVPCELLEWADSLRESGRRLFEYSDPTMPGFVSTVFLGLDHNHSGGRPLLFETMIFGGPHDQYQTRCSTYDEAEAMHAKAVRIFTGEEEAE
jgi:hypothetical protein